ncbi:MAG: 16S rRNA (guanine(966)-N(2))-methyltransferase RsmD [Eubacterium sp.]|nr:16S rRNA (guanine(966)-N(2))-methyltransferase RsmD [Eubacterium sp.]
MRVIAGKCRSMPLAAPAGEDTRPTTDRIKETLFNILMADVPGCRFLDLFAGSGGIGIEALSRGAAFCCFVDNSRAAVSVIRKNLQFTKLADDAEVLQMDVVSAVSLLDKKEPFDIVFLDPPYGQGLEVSVLERLASSRCVTDQTLFILETSLDGDVSFLEEAGFRITREKRYKTNRHLFFRIRRT